mmetsp:Transcript_16112/g.37057  ORF Transcript_16112/g.37057 Transcript_16112/m.37057 type:complete len:508 (-) Transcript_16112:286-1809(-)
MLLSAIMTMTAVPARRTTTAAAIATVTTTTDDNNNNNNNTVPRAKNAERSDLGHANQPDPCRQYRGVLHISQGDYNGGTTAILISFVLHQLAYAEQHQLLPWIHLSSYSKWVYDPLVHGGGGGGGDNNNNKKNRTFVMRAGQFTKQHAHCHGDCGCPPAVDFISDDFQVHDIPEGNGVWGSYFQLAPHIPKFDPLLHMTSSSSSTCRDKPLVRLSLAQLTKGLHNQCHYTAKPWRRGGMPADIRQDHLDNQAWLQQQRQIGARLVQRFVRLQPELQHRVEQALRQQEQQQQEDDNQMASVHCLAVHIRHSDKGNGRKRVPVRDFLPYVQAYVEHHRSPKHPTRPNHGNTTTTTTTTTNRPFVYLATDSSPVLTEIQQRWPRHVQERIRTQDGYDFGNLTTNSTIRPSASGVLLRSPNTTAVFALAAAAQDPTVAVSSTSRHDANLQVLTDALAMSHCQFLLHGLSGVTETSIFFNLELHRGAINLEDDDDDGHPSVADFERQLQQLR